MKNTKHLSLVLALLMAEAMAFAQSPAPLPIPARPSPTPPPLATPPAGADFNSRIQSIIAKTSQDTANLTRFSLDFPGGTPKQLAAAIEKAMGKPVNVVVPDEIADTKLPPIKVSGVTLPQLFQTLSEGSYKYTTDGRIQRSYGFQTIDGLRTDESIWTFYVSNRDAPAAGLSRFDLDFPGGSPKALVTAIQKAMGKPLNAIVPEQYADLELPALKMNNVNVSQLFQALEFASRKSEAYSTGNSFGGGGFRSNNYQIANTAYGFRTSGQMSDDSVWYFFFEKPALPPLVENKACRFYLLTPYLDRGLTVDDITTAIQSGWKMLGEKETPTISFHKETKLLIAVGEPGKLEIIDSVLKALEPPSPQSSRRFMGGGGGFRANGSAPATNSSLAEEPKNDQ